ncbi:hypothetical protein HK102_004764 [Quaeritorhiza haematococci]|nr:hypothetical protein HK102_004764 [Quaeritorhiza haematococci]
MSKINLEKYKIHSPLPESLESECSKAASILEHFIKGKNQLDATLIPPKIVQKAKGIAVITILKAGFVWSGRAGSGLVVARLPDGRWSAPCAIAAAGAGFGAQIGAQLTDCVFILNTTDAVKAFTHGGNVTFGGNLSVAAGPVGRSTEAAGAVVNFAPVYSYSKTKGLFAGLSLEGSVIITRGDANSHFYHRKVSAKEILTGGVEPPVAAEPLYRALNMRFGPNARGSNPSVDSPDTMSMPSPTTPTSNPYRGTQSLDRNYTDKRQQQQPAQYGSQTLTRDPKPPTSSSHPNLSTTTSSHTAPGFSMNKNVVKPAPPALPSRNIDGKNTGQVTALALYPFKGERPGDLSFKKGDTIVIVKQTESTNDWWVGRVNGNEGEFPANYVKIQ